MHEENFFHETVLFFAKIFQFSIFVDLYSISRLENEVDDKTEGISFSLFLQLPPRLQMIVHHVGYLRGFTIIVVLKFDLLL